MDSKRITPRSPRAALEPESVPMPAQRSKRARHPLVIAGNAIFTVLILLAIAGGVLFVLGKQRFEAAGPLAQDKVVVIPKDFKTREIAELLQREGVIDQPWTFIGGVIAKKAWSDLKAGEYQFQKQATLSDVVDVLVEGKVVQHLLTIPEGLTSEQIVQRLMETEALAGNIREIPREGTLLPESYRFTRGTPREQMIQRMQQTQRRVLAEVWERRVSDLPIRTPEQLVVLASLVEKETGVPEERTRVSAVFVNRLKQKMKLQSDPTIIYGLVGGKGTLGRPIMKKEIEQPTPYNTYVIEGLPPGPIANPGRASLEAAAGPARTKEIFFVADGTGAHAFADTYAEHLKNVARLRGLERQQRDAVTLGDVIQSPAAPAPAPASSQPTTASVDDGEISATVPPAARGRGAQRPRQATQPQQRRRANP
jgi:UPF0755 protein